LKDGDIVVYESLAVVMYLNTNYPEVPLVPADKAKSALVLKRFFEADSTVKKVIDAIIMKFRGQIKTPEDEERF